MESLRYVEILILITVPYFTWLTLTVIIVKTTMGALASEVKMAHKRIDRRITVQQMEGMQKIFQTMHENQSEIMQTNFNSVEKRLERMSEKIDKL